MGAGGSGTTTASAGAGYVKQTAAGNYSTSAFALTAQEEYVTVTIGIAPAP
ncbi:MAG: hypothetical protein OEV14_04010 [Gammaproteobacteria bacterium]|nr:hypothetical protein [Gammaproteobacteria bacterium]